MTIASELREMNNEQLTAELAETRKQLFELRFQAATERLDAPSELRKLRKTIARILTIQREREVRVSPAS
jgi:large subunit ribosomal protein L29